MIVRHFHRVMMMIQRWCEAGKLVSGGWVAWIFRKHTFAILNMRMMNGRWPNLWIVRKLEKHSDISVPMMNKMLLKNMIKIWPPCYLTFGPAFDPCKEIVKWMMPSLMETKTMMKKMPLNEFDQWSMSAENDKVWPPHYLTFGQAFDPCKEIVNSGHSAKLARLSIVCRVLQFQIELYDL